MGHVVVWKILIGFRELYGVSEMCLKFKEGIQTVPLEGDGWFPVMFCVFHIVHIVFRPPQKENEYTFKFCIYIVCLNF